MMPKYVERRQVEEAGGPVQLSTVFKAGDRDYALLSDTANNRTILSELPTKLGEEFGPLLRGLQARPGSPVDLDLGGKVEGYGVFTFPYGPVSYGVPEAGGFKFITYGERIVKVVPQVNFKKRGVENRAVGRDPKDVLPLIERSAGNFSAAYSSCFATAVEEALGLRVPSQTKWTRAVAMELERIYNHLFVFGRLSEAAAQNVATAQANILREEVLRLNARYFGHRYLFGINRIGGVSADLSKTDRKRLSGSIRAIVQEFRRLIDYFLSSRIFLDRLQTTAQLSRQDALTLGAVGPAARGSDVQWDDRLTYPIEPYGDIYVDVETEPGGDTMARTMVRVKEIYSSEVALRELLDGMPSDGCSAQARSGAPIMSSPEFSFCRVESPSGDLIQVVELDERGRIKALHIRPASLVNWLPFAKCLERNVFTDFQFAFESFGLNYADSDR